MFNLKTLAAMACVAFASASATSSAQYLSFEEVLSLADVSENNEAQLLAAQVFTGDEDYATFYFDLPAKDLAQAEAYFLKAYNNGMPEALGLLADMWYRQGDFAKALENSKLIDENAADFPEDLRAENDYRLAMIYRYNDQYRDLPLGARHFAAVPETSPLYYDAARELGAMYKKGLGVDKDKQKAKQLLSVKKPKTAADVNPEEAKETALQLKAIKCEQAHELYLLLRTLEDQRRWKATHKLY